jgi:hypothetical protein
MPIQVLGPCDPDLEFEMECLRPFDFVCPSGDIKSIEYVDRTADSICVCSKGTDAELKLNQPQGIPLI